MTSEALLLKDTASVKVQNITFKAAYQYSKVLVSVVVYRVDVSCAESKSHVLGAFLSLY